MDSSDPLRPWSRALERRLLGPSADVRRPVAMSERWVEEAECRYTEVEERTPHRHSEKPDGESVDVLFDVEWESMTPRLNEHLIHRNRPMFCSSQGRDKRR